MTTTSTPSSAAPTGRAWPDTVGFMNVLRSEWTKLRSIRSTRTTGAAAALAVLALSVASCWRYAYLLHHGQNGGGFEPTALSLSGVYLAQLLVVTLGVMAISSEHSTGLIRATFMAVPQRHAVLTAKALVFGCVTLLTGMAVALLAFIMGQAILRTASAGASLHQPGVLRAVLGAGLYLAAVGLLGLGIGALVRHTAGALAAAMAVLFVPSALVDLLPSGWHDTVQKYLPANAGSQVFAVTHSARALGPWTGYSVFCLYALVTVLAATAVTHRRDA